MAAHSRRETTVRRIDITLPVPSNHAELYKALAAAEREYRRDRDIPEHGVLFDDALTVTVTDDEVLISYEVTE